MQKIDERAAALQEETKDDSTPATLATKEKMIQQRQSDIATTEQINALRSEKEETFFSRLTNDDALDLDTTDEPESDASAFLASTSGTTTEIEPKNNDSLVLKKECCEKPKRTQRNNIKQKINKAYLKQKPMTKKTTIKPGLLVDKGAQTESTSANFQSNKRTLKTLLPLPWKTPVRECPLRPLPPRVESHASVRAAREQTERDDTRDAQKSRDEQQRIEQQRTKAIRGAREHEQMAAAKGGEKTKETLAVATRFRVLLAEALEQQENLKLSVRAEQPIAARRLTPTPVTNTSNSGVGIGAAKLGGLTVAVPSAGEPNLLIRSDEAAAIPPKAEPPSQPPTVETPAPPPPPCNGPNCTCHECLISLAGYIAVSGLNKNSLVEDGTGQVLPREVQVTVLDLVHKHMSSSPMLKGRCRCNNCIQEHWRFRTVLQPYWEVNIPMPPEMQWGSPTCDLDAKAHDLIALNPAPALKEKTAREETALCPGTAPHPPPADTAAVATYNVPDQTDTGGDIRMTEGGGESKQRLQQQPSTAGPHRVLAAQERQQSEMEDKGPGGAKGGGAAGWGAEDRQGRADPPTPQPTPLESTPPATTPATQGDTQPPVSPIAPLPAGSARDAAVDRHLEALMRSDARPTGPGQDCDLSATKEAESIASVLSFAQWERIRGSTSPPRLALARIIAEQASASAAQPPTTLTSQAGKIFIITTGLKPVHLGGKKTAWFAPHSLPRALEELLIKHAPDAIPPKDRPAWREAWEFKEGTATQDTTGTGWLLEGPSAKALLEGKLSLGPGIVVLPGKLHGQVPAALRDDDSARLLAVFDKTGATASHVAASIQRALKTAGFPGDVVVQISDSTSTAESGAPPGRATGRRGQPQVTVTGEPLGLLTFHEQHPTVALDLGGYSLTVTTPTFPASVLRELAKTVTLACLSAEGRTLLVGPLERRYLSDLGQPPSKTEVMTEADRIATTLKASCPGAEVLSVGKAGWLPHAVLVTAPDTQTAARMATEFRAGGGAIREALGGAVGRGRATACLHTTAPLACIAAADQRLITDTAVANGASEPLWRRNRGKTNQPHPPN